MDPMTAEPQEDGLAAARDRLREVVRLARRRKALAEGLRRAEPIAVTLPGLAALAVLSLKVFVPDAGGRLLWPAAGALAIVMLAFGLHVAFRFRAAARYGRTAWEIDRRLRLGDAFLTAVEIARTGARGLFEDALVERAARDVAEDRVRRAFPIPWFRPAWATSALLLVCALLLPLLLRNAADDLTPPGPTPFETVVVPDLHGLPLDDARNALDREGLEPGEVRVVPLPGPVGTVVTQEPGAGAIVPRGTNVHLGVTGREGGAGASRGDGSASPDPSPRGNEGPGDGPPDEGPAAEEPRGGDGDENQDGGSPPWLGESERTPAEFDDVRVKPLFGPSGETRRLETEVPVPRVEGRDPGPGEEGEPENRITDLLIRYEKQAEHAVSSGRIPQGDRKTVLGYFERIKELLDGR